MGIFDHMTDDRRRQLVGVLLLTIGLFLAASLGTHLYFALSGDLGPDIWASELGVQNRVISSWLFDVLGFAAWVVPVLLVMWGWSRIVDGEPLPLALKSVFLVAVSMIALALVYLVAGQRAASVSGVAGAFIADLGTRHIGKVGTFLAGAGAIVAITLLTTELDVEGLLSPFATAGERIGEWARSLAASRRASSARAANRPRKKEPRSRGRERPERPRGRAAKQAETPASARRARPEEAESPRAERRRAPGRPRSSSRRARRGRSGPSVPRLPPRITDRRRSRSSTILLPGRTPTCHATSSSPGLDSSRRSWQTSVSRRRSCRSIRVP